MRLLVVDDERFNLAVAEKIIKEANFPGDILLCNRPEEVLEIMGKEKIDIVLLDIVMPKISGIEILQQIREKRDFDNVPVIMLTALTDKKVFKTCFESGANDYINKPIDIVELMARLQAAVNTRKSALLLQAQNQELKKLNQQLKDTQFHIIQKEKMASLGELAAGVAHEINNPMGFLSSNLETLGVFMERIKYLVHVYRQMLVSMESECNNSNKFIEAKEYVGELEKKQKTDFILEDFSAILEDSREGVERVTKIVQSLRNFARTGLEDEMLYHNLNTIIEEALLIVKNEAKYTLDIEKELADLPLVFCDKGQIGQVLLNLLVNAVQAIKSQEREERGKIKIETYLEDSFVSCRITDDGPGIKEEYLNRIFDPFFTTKEVGKGTGLGLSISYDIIVKKHKGEFNVESQLGRGSIFVFRIPLLEQDEAL